MNADTVTWRRRADLVNTALGRAKADVVFHGAHLVNVYSGEILPHLWVAFKGERIAYVGSPNNGLVGEKTEVCDVSGRFLLPGFIDGHTHLDSIFRVRAYAPFALAHGNTTAVSEVAMIANAFGEDGVNCFLEETDGLPLKVYVLAPPLVPPFPDLETSRPFSERYFQRLLAMDRCLGVGETYWPRVLSLEERVLKQYDQAEALGKTREGHGAGARDDRLVAYAAAGTSSCHEATALEEALERIRLGLALMIREGYVRRELEAISGISKQPLDLHHVMVVTDMADPEELVTLGGMNLLVRKAVALGFEPVTAVQMVTHNVARYFGLMEVGGLAPGKRADMVVVDDLKEFRCHQVWSEGELVARDGEPIGNWDGHQYPPPAYGSVMVERVVPEFFSTKAPGNKTHVRVVEIVNETITRETVEPMGESGAAGLPDTRRDILKVAVLDKGNRTPTPSVSFIKGVGFRAGAVATSLVWDTNNILVVGTSDGEMAVALNRLIALGGGLVVCRDREVMAELPLPICGIISPEPLPAVSRRIRAVEDACHRLGSPLSRPLLTFQTIPFTGLPYLRPTDKGLADIRKGKLVPLWV